MTVLTKMWYAIYTLKRQAHINLRGVGYMLNEKICKLRERLNESIITGKNYKEIYSISVELDELIAKYYIDEKYQRNKKTNFS